MIHVEKDFDDVPKSLLIEDTGKSLTGFRDVEYKLQKIYNGKCAYCETQIGEKGLINHYRPVDKYSWLMGEWSNLHYCCETCRKSIKNQFPVEGDRITEPLDKMTDWKVNSKILLAEKPLLLNPEIDIPEEYFGFHPDGRIFAVDNNSRASATIKGFDLNRLALVSRRMQYLETYIKLIADCLKNNIEAVKNVLSEIARMSKPENEFSLMHRYIMNEYFSMLLLKNFSSMEIEDISSYFIVFSTMRKIFPGFILSKNHEDKKTGQKKEKEFLNITLERVELNNIKCFKKAELAVNNSSAVIVGTNGRGKSTLLQVLSLLFSGIEHPGVLNDWTGVITHGELHGGGSIVLNVEGQSRSIDFVISSEDKLSITANHDILTRFRAGCFFAAYGSSRNAVRTNVDETSNFGYIATIFNNPGYMKNIRDSRVYKMLEDNFSPIQDLINTVFKVADENNFVRLTGFDVQSFYFEIPADREGRTSLEAMSDGFRSMFSMLFDMLCRMYDEGYDLKDLSSIIGIVLVDEIDLHLHPSWQRSILPVLKENFPGIQFIVTTHSPFIVQSLDSNSVFQLQLEDDGVGIHKIENPGVPQGYEIKEIIKNIFGSETDNLEISNILRNKLTEFKKTVEMGEQGKDQAAKLYMELKDMVPEDSAFSDYLRIMSVGIRPGK